MEQKKIQLRQITNEAGVNEYWVEGYGAVFNHMSRLLFSKTDNQFFYEIIERQAFDEVLTNTNLNVIMNYQHDSTQILARTTSGTLQLSTDDYGLKYSFKLPDTQLGRDVKELIERGDIYESSFAFYPDFKTIRKSKHIDGYEIKTISKIVGLYDCALVTDGAYSDTYMSILQRDYISMIDMIEEREYNELENLKLQITLLKIDK